MISIDDIGFDDVLKDPNRVRELLFDTIDRELNDHDRKLKALTSIRIVECKNSRVEDLLKLLEYRRE